MAHESHDTKEALLLAAGELFAERGYDGTSIRAIAEKAKANIAAINYHFGSKDALYASVLGHVCRKVHFADAGYLESVREAASDQEKANILRDATRAVFAKDFAPGRPAWHTRMIMRSLMEPSPALQKVVHDVFHPEFEALKAIFRAARPTLTEEAAEFMVFSLAGQEMFYSFAQSGVLILLGRRDYEPAFLEKAIEHVARCVTAALGLPAPSLPDNQSGDLSAFDEEGEHAE